MATIEEIRKTLKEMSDRREAEFEKQRREFLADLTDSEGAFISMAILQEWDFDQEEFEKEWKRISGKPLEYPLTHLWEKGGKEARMFMTDDDWLQAEAEYAQTIEEMERDQESWCWSYK